MNLCTEFINLIFNNLNWAITEFEVAANKLQTPANRHERVHPGESQQHQRKCNIMYELSVCLARIVELVSLEIPEAFNMNDINMSRLSEILIFLLSRTTTGKEAKNFENLLAADIIALDKITRMGIFCPIVGIITNLQPDTGNNKLAKSIASTGGFQLEIFQYLLKFNWEKVQKETDDKMRNSLKILGNFVEDLEREMQSQTKKEEEAAKRADDSEEELCSICCSAELDTKFEPCGHRSCNRCIKRHMLNNPKCFFCNAHIDSIHLEKEPMAE